jgi:hypothetical protein
MMNYLPERASESAVPRNTITQFHKIKVNAEKWEPGHKRMALSLITEEVVTKEICEYMR